MKKFWKPEILEVAAKVIFYVKSSDDHDAAIKKWLRPKFFELEAFI